MTSNFGSSPVVKYAKRHGVLIVADGPSAAVLRNFYIPQEVYVIGVNGAAHWLPRVDAFFTLDPAPRQRWMMQNQRQGVRYFAAVPDHYGSAFAKGNMRGPREAGVTFLRRIEGPGPHSSAPGMNRNPSCINTGNSAWGAMGIAHHMKAMKIGLVGVDGSNRPRVSGGRPNDLSHLPWLFSTYDGPADVRNGSPGSAIECFDKMSAQEVIQWLL